MDEHTIPTAPEENSGATAPRLTLRLIGRDLAARFFSLERGWLRTAKELFSRPGPMIRGYIEGERKAYANPFAYLLAGTAVNVLAQTTIGFQDWMMASTLNNPELSPAQVALARNLQDLFFQHMLYISLGILIPFAISLRLFFRRSDFNLAEMTVFALYTGGHIALFGAVLLPLSRLLSWHPAVLGGPVSLAYLGYAAIGFFGGRIITVLKSWVSYALGFCCYTVVVLVGVLIYLIGFGAASIRSEDEWNLVSASEQGLAAMVESLLEQGADVDLTLQRTALHVAADQGNLEIVELLLAKGANPDARDHRGRVPLFFAIWRDHREIVRRLVAAGADPLARDSDGTTLLLMAARTDDTDLVRRLLEEGAEVNAVRARGNRVTALMQAADRGHQAIVELLLEHGADPAITNEEGETALDLAESEAIARLLRAAAGEEEKP